MSTSPLQRVPSLVLFIFSLGACAPSTNLLRAEHLVARGDYDRADTILRRALKEHPEDPNLLALSLRTHLARGERKKALLLYRHHRGRDLLRRYAIGAIWAAMRDQDPAIRLAGIHAARQADAPELVKEMIRRLSDPDGRVRSWAAVALSTRAIGAEVLQRQLRAPMPEARAIAVSEVGRIAKAKAYDAVMPFVTDPNAVVRAAAAKALAYTQRQQALPLLIKLAGDAARAVRLAAVQALGTLGKIGGRQAVRQHLHDAYLPLRLAALNSYAKLAGADALPYLREAAAGRNSRLALHAARILARRGETQPILNAIAKALVDRQWTLRAAGINTASTLQDKVAWDLAARGLRDPEPAVRLATIRMFRAHSLVPQKANHAAQALFSLLCANKRPATLDSPACSRCTQAAALLAQNHDRRGRMKILEVLRKGARWQDRAEALRAGLRFAPSARLAMAALGDTQPRVNLVAAIYVCQKLR